MTTATWDNIPHYGGEGVKKSLNVLRNQIPTRASFTDPAEISQYENEQEQVSDNGEVNSQNQEINKDARQKPLNRASQAGQHLRRKATRKVAGKLAKKAITRIAIWIGWLLLPLLPWIAWAVVIWGVIFLAAAAISDKGLAAKLAFEWWQGDVGGRANTVITGPPGAAYVDPVTGWGTTTGGTTTGSDDGYVNSNSYPNTGDDDDRLSSEGVMAILDGTYSVKNGKEEWVNGLRKSTADGLIAMSDACVAQYGSDGGCSGWIVTSGTDSEHAAGVYSHANGYKVDLRNYNSGPMGTNPSQFIKNSGVFTKEPYQTSGYDTYTATIDGYQIRILDEGDHWDVRVKKP